MNVLVDTSVWSLALRRAKRVDDTVTHERDHEDAADAFNRCREKGIQGSNTDFLICGAARRRRAAIFSTDADFTHFAPVVGVKLHRPR